MTVDEAKKILLAAPLNPREKTALRLILSEIDCKDLPNEEWRDPVDDIDYEGDYQISNLGRAKSFKKCKVTILKPAFNGDYYFVNFYKNGKAKMHYIHILVAKTFIPNPENKPEVNHISGDKTDNRVDNLAWVTPSENKRHAVEMGLVSRGCDNGNSKLTADQVREIRRDCVPGDLKRGFKVFAKKFNVIYETISDAYYRITYKNVE